MHFSCSMMSALALLWLFGPSLMTAAPRSQGGWLVFRHHFYLPDWKKEQEQGAMPESSSLIGKTNNHSKVIGQTGSHCHPINKSIGEAGKSHVMIDLRQSGSTAGLEHIPFPNKIGLLMTQMKCKCGRPPTVSATNRNGGRLARKTVPKRSHSKQ